MADIELKTTEKKYLTFYLKEYGGESSLDLTGSSVIIQLQREGETTLVVDTTCDIVDAENGVCRYLYEGNLPVGIYKGELEIAYGISFRPKTPNFYLNIVPDLPE